MTTYSNIVQDSPKTRSSRSFSPKSTLPKPVLLLGSSSPRRIEILRYFSLPFEQKSPPFAEESVPFSGDPEEYVRALSEGKARSLEHELPILTADTIVFHGGRVYGKPTSREHAREMLQTLSGEWHSVFTALTLSVGGELHTLVEETRVKFRKPTEEQLESALAILPLQDKAGAYMIQGGGSLMVERIDGCYYNVVGLPIGALATLLTKIDIDLWKQLR